ncbi:MAG: hypothetical protein O7D86_15230 [Proteobacteria bacterium]|nr:hypothetical protein [Pseudomonadota bacterium]
MARLSNVNMSEAAEKYRIRKAKERANKKALSLQRYEVWVHSEDKEQLKKYAQNLINYPAAS